MAARRGNTPQASCTANAAGYDLDEELTGKQVMLTASGVLKPPGGPEMNVPTLLTERCADFTGTAFTTPRARSLRVSLMLKVLTTEASTFQLFFEHPLAKISHGNGMSDMRSSSTSRLAPLSAGDAGLIVNVISFDGPNCIVPMLAGPGSFPCRLAL